MPAVVVEGTGGGDGGGGGDGLAQHPFVKSLCGSPVA